MQKKCTEHTMGILFFLMTIVGISVIWWTINKLHIIYGQKCT